MVLIVKRNVAIPERELHWSFSRASGPGGQNVNKVETRVTVRFHPESSAAFSDAQRERVMRKLASHLTRDGELVISSDRYRSQERNRADVQEKLAETLRKALVVPRSRKKTKPTRSSVRKRLDKKRKLKEKKRRRKSVLDD